MNSVWYEMGMRSGLFKGTNPATFMNCAYRFFLDLRYQCRKSWDPSIVLPDYETKFVFNARDKNWRDFTNNFYRRYFTYREVPMGTPIPEEVWNSDKPTWEKTSFTEEEILGEKPIIHPLEDLSKPGGGKGQFSMTCDWESQRYRLIQKMRYCLVPIKIMVFEALYDKTWKNWYGNTGFLDRDGFGWEGYSRVRASFFDYWTQGNTVFKIGIFAENKTPGLKVPFNGGRWISQKEFTSAKAPDDDPWLGISTLRIYGAVDLSTHPDYEKFFDLEEPETPEEKS